MHHSESGSGWVQNDLDALPGTDAASLARRTAAFARELGAVGDVGWLLARRAAVLAGRMERLAVRDEVMVELNVQAARDTFDAERRAERAEWVADLRGTDPERIAIALARLETTPEGLDTLHQVWGRIAEGVRSDDPTAVTAASTEARALLAAAGLEVPGDAAGLGLLVAAEVARLHRRDERTRAALAAVVADARREVGLAAMFDPSPEAVLARRHEAAAERGFFRALKLIRDLRRDAGLAPMAEAEALAPLPAAPPAPQPAPDRPRPPAGRPAAPPVALGSFRFGLDLPAAPAEASLASFSIGVEPEPRRRRPDLAKAHGKRR